MNVDVRYETKILQMTSAERNIYDSAIKQAKEDMDYNVSTSWQPKYDKRFAVLFKLRRICNLGVYSTALESPATCDFCQRGEFLDLMGEEPLCTFCYRQLPTKSPKTLAHSITEGKVSLDRKHREASMDSPSLENPSFHHLPASGFTGFCRGLTKLEAVVKALAKETGEHKRLVAEYQAKRPADSYLVLLSRVGQNL